MEIRWKLEQLANLTKQTVIGKNQRLRVRENESIREVELLK